MSAHQAIRLSWSFLFLASRTLVIAFLFVSPANSTPLLVAERGPMSLNTVQEIERAIGALSPRELEELYAWLGEHGPQPISKAVDALEKTAPAERRRTEGRKSLVELAEPVRGLLTDEELDRLVSRNPSTGRPLDFA